MIKLWIILCLMRLNLSERVAGLGFSASHTVLCTSALNMAYFEKAAIQNILYQTYFLTSVFVLRSLYFLKMNRKCGVNHVLFFQEPVIFNEVGIFYLSFFFSRESLSADI